MQARLIDAFRRAHGLEPAAIARAPGRIEFIGNHTDYNGGPVLGAAIDRSVWVAVAPIAGDQLRLHSPAQGAVIQTPAATPQPLTGAAAWTNYPVGVLEALRQRGMAPKGAFALSVESDLPPGSGLSSSAAIELATALALTALSGAEPSRRELAVLAREAENRFVGVPCGILDQGVSAHGQADQLVFIDCDRLEFRTVPMPAGTRFWIFNTHKKHALVDSYYKERHRECMEAARVLRERFPALPCLAAATLEQLQTASGSLRPEVLRRARHVIEETARVHSVVAALGSGDLAAVGRALTASHRSSQHQFENSVPELDFLVDALEANPAVWGARLTGGGFGGAVMAMTQDRFGEDAAQAVAKAYQDRFGTAPDLLACRAGAGAQRLPLKG